MEPSHFGTKGLILNCCLLSFTKPSVKTAGFPVSAGVGTPEEVRFHSLTAQHSFTGCAPTVGTPSAPVRREPLPSRRRSGRTSNALFRH